MTKLPRVGEKKKRRKGKKTMMDKKRKMRRTVRGINMQKM